MSTITNVLILAMVDEDKALAQLNAALREQTDWFEGPEFKNFADLPYVPGGRIFEATVAFGSFNGLQGDSWREFLRCFDSVKWQAHDEVQLLVKGDADTVFGSLELDRLSRPFPQLPAHRNPPFNVKREI